MNTNETKYYLLGLNDAIKELQMEIECCEMELSGEALIATRYTLRNGILLIKDLIQATELGL